MQIKEKTAEKAWKKVLRHILDNGIEFIDRENRLCKECMNITLTVESIENIDKPIEMLNSFNKWVYPPLEELKNLMLSKKESSGYYYKYGSRTFNYDGINQIDDFIIPLLKKDPNTRRAIVVFYNPNKDSSPEKKETPGMVLVNFNIRDKKLHATTVIRSNDLFYGWPGNIVQTYFLADYVSKELNIPIGTLNTTSISAHIFEDQFEDIRKILRIR